MPKKYFTAFCLMDSKNLRANMFHHGCLVFFEADCDEKNEIVLPLRIVDSYGFYSHPVPYKKSYYEEPLTFLSQKLVGNFRLKGSYGEWRQENIHDLTYGRGLSGRLFEMNIEQFYFIQTRIKDIIKKQEEFLATADNLIDLEENYKNYSRTEFIKLIKAGVDPEEARKKTKNIKPLPEFNSIPFAGHPYSCKNAALTMMAECYASDQQNVIDYINQLKGFSPTSVIPKWTNDLDEIILHCSSDQWEAMGNESKYPYCAWNKIEDKKSLFAISAGSWYVDKDGCKTSFLTLNHHFKQIVRDLKLISRICEINISSINFNICHEKINHYLNNLATCKNEKQQLIRCANAEKYLETLMNCEEFIKESDNHVPVNLKSLFDDIINRYKPVYAITKSYHL
jgi:hypothetical protein